MKQMLFLLFVFAVNGIAALQEDGPVIILGSTNPVKYESLRRVVEDYPFLSNSKIVPISVPSNVSDQPKTMEETIRGAMNRAKNAFAQGDCDYSVGIESGLMQLPTREGFKCYDITACAVFDGKSHKLGFSCSFELPSRVTTLIKDKNIDLGDAMRLSGLTSKFEVGKEEGSIGVLSKGRISRQDYTEQAIHMAFIPIENADEYVNLACADCGDPNHHR